MATEPFFFCSDQLSLQYVGEHYRPKRSYPVLFNLLSRNGLTVGSRISAIYTLLHLFYWHALKIPENGHTK